MMKKEIIEEIKNAIATNGGEVRNGDITYYIDGEYVKVSYWNYIHVLNDKSDKELKRHLDIIKRGIKKNIIKGLHEDGEAKCDLETAEAFVTEGFIFIDSYEDGVLYGDIDYDFVCEYLIGDDDYELFGEVRDGEFGYHDIDQVTDWYDMGYLDEIEYGGNGKWYCRVNWDNVIDVLCKRLDVEKEAA